MTASKHQQEFIDFCNYLTGLENVNDKHILRLMIDFCRSLGLVAKNGDKAHSLAGVQQQARTILQQTKARKTLPSSMIQISNALSNPDFVKLLATEVWPVICSFPGYLHMPKDPQP